MPRRPRITVGGVPLHIIQRGNNRSACFFRTADRTTYLNWLAEYSRLSDCAIHAYVLMNNHVHLLLTPARPDSAALLMRRLGQRYVQYINRAYQRSGTLWEGRFRSCITQDERYVLACYRYIEMNPVRAGMVERPEDYLWSSCRANTRGECMFPLEPHPDFLSLGIDPDERHARYRTLLDERATGMTEDIRAATNGNFALGDDAFKERMAAALGRRVVAGKAGRPRRSV